MKRLGITVALSLLCLGCARYYKVTDVETRKVYYTKSVDKLDSSSVSFVNSETGSGATVEGAQVDEITKEEYEQGIQGSD